MTKRNEKVKFRIKVKEGYVVDCKTGEHMIITMSDGISYVEEQGQQGKNTLDFTLEEFGEEAKGNGET